MKGCNETHQEDCTDCAVLDCCFRKFPVSLKPKPMEVTEYTLWDGTPTTAMKVIEEYNRGRTRLVHRWYNSKKEEIITGLMFGTDCFNTKGSCDSVWDEKWTSIPENVHQAVKAAAHTYMKIMDVPETPQKSHEPKLDIPLQTIPKDRNVNEISQPNVDVTESNNLMKTDREVAGEALRDMGVATLLIPSDKEIKGLANWTVLVFGDPETKKEKFQSLKYITENIYEDYNELRCKPKSHPEQKNGEIFAGNEFIDKGVEAFRGKLFGDFKSLRYGIAYRLDDISAIPGERAIFVNIDEWINHPNPIEVPMCLYVVE